LRLKLRRLRGWGCGLIDSVMFWNEPNNKSHWDFEIDPEWQAFSDMVRLASDAVASENPNLIKVLGGMSPIDPLFVRRMIGQCVLEKMDAVAVHGFPLDWNHWKLDEWPEKIRSIEQEVPGMPVWVSEVGVSSFGADEVQEFGLTRTAQLLLPTAIGNRQSAIENRRVHWYSLYDLPAAWEATTRHKEAEGSAYYRHFYMGLIREDGTPKPAYNAFRELTPQMGMCQWFHFEDHRLDDAVRHLKDLGVTYLRTGLSWADTHRPNCLDWFDRQMSTLEDFNVTVTFCFTPATVGVAPHYTSPPQRIEEFADFCAWMVARYAPHAGGYAVKEVDAVGT
jgi:beta-xylosidase